MESIFHGGDTGISFGETVANYNLFGKDYEIKSRWTATLVKENGKWLLAAYHISMNTLDNPLLTVLGHPTGRLLLSRDAYAVDMDVVLEKAGANGVAYCYALRAKPV